MQDVVLLVRPELVGQVIYTSRLAACNGRLIGCGDAVYFFDDQNVLSVGCVLFHASTGDDDHFSCIRHWPFVSRWRWSEVCQRSDAAIWVPLNRILDSAVHAITGRTITVLIPVKARQ